MPSAQNIELKSVYEESIKASPNFILASYSGLTVSEMTELRQKLAGAGSKFQVIKNNVFRLALLDSQEIEGINATDVFKGTLGVAYAGENLPAVAKVIKSFAKDQENLVPVGAIMEQQFYDAKGVEAISKLPTKEQVLATLASMLNTPATQIAGGINNIMGSLARAIKAVGEKNG